MDDACTSVNCYIQRTSLGGDTETTKVLTATILHRTWQNNWRTVHIRQVSVNKHNKGQYVTQKAGCLFLINFR